MTTSSLVIKVGGALLDEDSHALALLKVVKQLQLTRKLVLVHGGGNKVEKLLTELKLGTRKINGLRVTPDNQLPYVIGALAGTTNKQLCALAIQAGLDPVGLSLADGKMTICRQLAPELGAVGIAKPGEAKLLNTLLAEDYLPIIGSIGADPQGRLLNINADQAATAIAKLLKADLWLLSDVPGVLDDNRQCLVSLSPDRFDQLVDKQVIKDGMLVKVKAAQEAASDLQRPVTIASWRSPEQLLATNGAGSIGTQILPQIPQETA